ncbi:MAG TPA: ZIP family metal transporter, partial [Bryobacteraceae bacterium]|nr:ZIP family metal transporter [Bryobacteraceae bacterium]
MFSISITALLFFAVLALAATLAGVAISGIPELSRRILPFSGAMLLLISFLWVLPELAEDLGWPTGLAFMMIGFMILWLIDKHVYPVCPSCSHTHDHDSCVTRLHGFAAPLLAATAIHSTFDGWALAASHTAGRQGIWAGVLVHKIPECVVFGIVLRAAMKSRRNALIAATLAQSATLLGAALEIQLAPHIGTYFILVLLAIAGGTFLYLGFHAVHGE